MKTLPPRLMFSQTVCLAASVLLVWNAVLAQAPVATTDGTWVFTNPMSFTATRLLDGRALVAGGFVSGAIAEPGAEPHVARTNPHV